MSTSWPYFVAAIGIVAACLTTGCWIPQAVRTIRTRSAGDFAWSYLALFASGLFLWLVYGIFRRDVALIGSNAITLALVARIASVKWAGNRPAGPEISASGEKEGV